MTQVNTIDRLKRRIHDEVPISEVIKSRIPIIGGKALCPFHDDKNVGSFQYSDQKGVYTCFACGETGDSISFISNFDGVDFVEAVLRIACEFSLISREEYETMSRTKEFAGKRKRVFYQKERTIEVKDPEFLDSIYSEMVDILSLSEKHRDYLYSRGLSDYDILEGRYFSFEMNDITQDIVSRLIPYGYNAEDLIGVPGFYRDHDGNVAMQLLQGVAIPMVDSDGLIRAIQVRNDEVKEGGARYIFFSSTRRKEGCSSGAPADVVFPPERNTTDLYITEGHFKALVLAKATNSTVISVQGINNIKTLYEELPKLAKDVTRVIIAYDADIYRNKEVFNASRKLTKLVKEVLPDVAICYFVWDPRTGKGVDDSLANGNRSFRLVKADQYERFYKAYQQATSKLSDEERLKSYLTIIKKP